MDSLTLIRVVPNLNRLKLIRRPLISKALQSRYTALMFKFQKELLINDPRRYFATVHWDRVNHLSCCGYYDEELKVEYVEPI